MPEPQPQPGGAGGTVLIVEDEPAMREEAGVNLIQKPLSEAELLAALRRITASVTPHRAP
jgi:hypothetical protein